MGRKKRFIKLTEAEKSSLEKCYKTGTSHVYRRKCHCILLSNEGKDVHELSDYFDVHTVTVYSWFNEWESSGAKGLELKPGRGRKAKLSLNNDQHVNKVKEFVQNEPQNLNRVLPMIKEELGVELSKKTLKRFLKNLNTVGNALGNE